MEKLLYAVAADGPLAFRYAANALARGVNAVPASAFAVDRSTLEHGMPIKRAAD